MLSLPVSTRLWSECASDILSLCEWWRANHIPTKSEQREKLLASWIERIEERAQNHPLALLMRLPHHEVAHKRVNWLLESSRSIFFKEKVSDPSEAVAEQRCCIQKPIVLKWINNENIRSTTCSGCAIRSKGRTLSSLTMWAQSQKELPWEQRSNSGRPPPTLCR